MQMNFDKRDSSVNTLMVATFNLLSLAVQGDTGTQRFELIERFIEARIYCDVLFSLHLDPTFEILSLKLG